MLLLAPERIDERRAATAGPLAPLADSLSLDLDPLLERDLYVPTAKALLSRAGGRCRDDGAQLVFDPYSPHDHGCPTCGRVFRGELHHRWWVYSYQLWLAERAVHSALLYLLRGHAPHARLAREIAHRYAESYAQYPNRDNVLGPARLFFSTYLESIWLLQLCITADLLEAAGESRAGGEIRVRIVEPAAAIIAQYDEGLSNRQVWNNAALLAAALLRGDRRDAERILRAPSGVEAHLRYGLLEDGTWYEGENYHLFAHRGLWYSVVMAESAGMTIDPALLARFQEGFATPFATALPDFTLPARKDSRYAVSLRQFRFAELCELGLARRDDPRVTYALARIYDPSSATGDTGRSRSTADVEHDMPPCRLTRADLGWRSLLHARPQPTATETTAPRSELLEGQGIAVFRRAAGDVYVALDYGESGGGHGHPDRLNLLWASGRSRLLDDLGTGSYVDQSLHWYRSTLAHNAPLFNGRSQFRTNGTLRAWDERGGVGWVLAEADGLAPGVRVQRALIVTPDYFVDEIRWTADHQSRFELPIHFGGEFMSPGVSLAREAGAMLDGGQGVEDGFSCTRDVLTASLAPKAVVTLRQFAESAEPPELGPVGAGRMWVCAESASRWYRALAPGQPATTLHPFFVVRCEGTEGVVRTVGAWSPRVTDAGFSEDHIVIALGAERHEHYQTPEHWQVELTVGGAKSGIELTGWKARAAMREGERPADSLGAASRARAPLQLRRGVETHFDLGEAHYRRSEETWREAGRPSARVTLRATATELVVDVDAMAKPPMFVARDTVNPYDNEHPDINGHGVQLYVRTASDGGGWIIVPEPDHLTARSRSLEGWGGLALRRSEWSRTPHGYLMRAVIDLPAAARGGEYPISVDVLVNETVPGRERRRGQLVLSGGAGEFVYLRGDRHDPDRLMDMLLVD